MVVDGVEWSGGWWCWMAGGGGGWSLVVGWVVVGLVGGG